MQPPQILERTPARSAKLCALLVAVGMIAAASIKVAFRSYYAESGSTLLDFVMPFIFLFFFWRIAGVTHANFARTWAPWSFEGLFKNGTGREP